MKSKLDIIQLLRALAAMLVCFFHMKGLLKQGDWGKFLFGNGSVGVPLFFMISGFIMYYTTYTAKTNWKYIRSYFIKRIIRIVPLYFLMTLLYILLLNNGQFYFIENPRLLLSTFFFFPTYANHIGPSYGMPALAVGWSLNYEIYFYLILGFSMLFTRNRWVVLIGILMTSVFIIPLFTNGYVMNRLSDCYSYSWPYFSLMTNPILLFFVAGIFIARFYTSDYLIGNVFYSKALVLLAISNFIFSYFNLYPFLLTWHFHLFNSGFLIFSLINRNKIQAYKIPSIILFIGNSSYSLYLIHPLILTLLPRILRRFKLIVQYEGVPLFILTTGIILLLSYVSYLLIEQRLSRKIQSLVLKE